MTARLLTKKQRYIAMLAEAPTTAPEAAAEMETTVHRASAWLSYLCQAGIAERRPFHDVTRRGKTGGRPVQSIYHLKQ